MARYIDVDNLAEMINARAEMLVEGKKAFFYIADWLNKLPTADVVEVVRCRDCKFNVANMEKDPLDITDYSGVDIVCSYFLTDGLDPNDYCSRGKRTKMDRERRENENDRT